MRKQALHRAIKNETDLIVRLQSAFNVEPIVLEEYSIEGQAHLFAQADIIIAPHGAGLTNLVFARPGTMVIELFQYHLDETFWVLSQQMGLRHYCIIGLNTGEHDKLHDLQFAQNEGRYASTLLDIGVIEKEIRRLLQIYASVFNAWELDHLAAALHDKLSTLQKGELLA